MNLLFLASGSGGHVYPCLSLIKKAKLQNKYTFKNTNCNYISLCN